MKPPALARVTYDAADLVTASRHDARAREGVCRADREDRRRLQRRAVHAVAVSRPQARTSATTLVFPGGLGGANWGGTAFDPGSRFIFVATQDVGALGSMENAKEGSAVPYEKTTPGRSTFDVRIGRRELAVPEATVGPPDGDQRLDRRLSRGRFRSASPNSFRLASRTPAGPCWRVPS